MVLLVWLSPPEIKLKPVKFLNTFNLRRNVLLVIPDDIIWQMVGPKRRRKLKMCIFFLCVSCSCEGRLNFWQINVLHAPVCVGGVGGRYKYARVDCRLLLLGFKDPLFV